MKAAALRGALSDRARNDRLHVVDALISAETPSTRAAIAALATLSERRHFLDVLERTDSVTWLSLRNAHQVHIVAVDQLNTYDVLASDDVVFTKGAYDAFVAVAPKGAKGVVAAVSTDTPKAAPAKATEVKAFADTGAETDAVELPAGAKAPLKSGKNPKGYEVKGKADSGLYHEPDGQWYDATVAEFWFKSAQDAEAAGFRRAGSKEDDK
jgi:large subunit ribosomal protein L4